MGAATAFLRAGHGDGGVPCRAGPATGKSALSRRTGRAIFTTSARSGCGGWREPFTLVSFDNHPDWDIRPPKWCCGSWMNRALDLPSVERIAVWGCGNFECWGWPRVWGNHRDVRSGRLAVHPWADERPAADRARPGSITRETWREMFTRIRRRVGREIGVRDRGHRRPARRGRRDQLGKRPLHRRRRGLGVGRTRPPVAHRGGRPVRGAFATGLRALDAALSPARRIIRNCPRSMPGKPGVSTRARSTRSGHG